MNTNKEMQWISKMSFLLNALFTLIVALAIFIIWTTYVYAKKLKENGYMRASVKDPIPVNSENIKPQTAANLQNAVLSTDTIKSKISTEKITPQKIETNASYYLVAASLTDKQNTGKIMKNLKKKVSNTTLLEDDANGRKMYRLCVFKADDLESAKKKREEFEEIGLETWVLKKVDN